MVAVNSHKYVTAQIYAVFMHAISDSIILFMAAMGQTYVILMLQVSVIPLHIFGCWFFVHYFEYELVGAAYAENLTSGVTLALQIIYVSNIKEISDAVYMPTYETFQDLTEFVKIAINGSFMLFLENLNV